MESVKSLKRSLPTDTDLCIICQEKRHEPLFMFGPSKAKKFIEAAQALVGTDAVVEPPVSEEAAKVDKTEAVSESGAEAETTENNAEMPIGPKVCTQKFSQKAKKKRGKGTKAKKKKKKSSRNKKSK